MDELYRTMLQRLLADIKLKELTHAQDTTLSQALAIARREIERRLRSNADDA